MCPPTARSAFLLVFLVACADPAQAPSPEGPAPLLFPPDRVEGVLEVEGESLAVEGVAHVARFHPVEQECSEASLIYFQLDGFGGSLVVEGDTLEGVTTLAPLDSMDVATLWYQDPGPNWSEDDPWHNAYGGVWRLSRVDDSLVVSLEPERICPGLPLMGGCTQGVPVRLTVSGRSLTNEPCDFPAESAWPSRSDGDPPLCSGYPMGSCGGYDENGN